MKHKIKVILSAQLFLVIVFSIFINTAYASEMSTNSINLTLNSNATGYISPGNEITYFFTAPTTGFYTVETSGSTDVYGTVSVSYDGNTYTYSDDDSGVGLNFAIGFRQTSGTVATIHVSHAFPTYGSGMFSIQVRRQKARIYTGYYPAQDDDQEDVDTRPDSVQPSLYLSTIGYEVCVHENESPYHATSFDNNFRRLNSEIFFFSGHGDTGIAQFPQFFGGVNCLNTYEMTDQNLVMNNTKVALWASCKSATSNHVYTSLPDASVQLGAKSAVGFKNTIGTISARLWSNRFFYALVDGYTVTSAVAFANALLLPGDHCRQNDISGYDYTTINTPNVNPKTSNFNNNTSQQELYKQFEYDISEFNYTLYEDNNIKQYFKTINGIITNDFYAIIGDGTIIKSVETISQQEIDNILSDIEKINFDFYPQVKNKITEDKITFDKLISSEEHTIFYKKNGVVTPIKIVYSDYENDNGYSTCHVDCVNLLNNSSVDYETLTFDYDFPILK